LREEKETLGLYLSGHPIDEFLPELRQMTRDSLANLKADRDTQVLAGLLVATRTMRSKRGDNIAFITLDDRSARLEISLFAKEYERFRDILQKDAILVVDCQVSMDDFSGTLKGRAREVMNLTQARLRYASAVQLELKADTLGKDFSLHLAKILTPYRVDPAKHQVVPTAQEEGAEPAPPVSCPVRICYRRPDISGWITLGEQWQVKPEQALIHDLKQLFGQQAVSIAYR
jgi:DNA polymerase-3 subunit alpha